MNTSDSLTSRFKESFILLYLMQTLERLRTMLRNMMQVAERLRTMLRNMMQVVVRVRTK